MAPSGSPRRQASQWQQQDVGACPCRTDSKAFVHRGELYLFGGEVRRSGLDQVRSKVPALRQQAGCCQLWLGLDKTGALSMSRLTMQGTAIPAARHGYTT